MGLFSLGKRRLRGNLINVFKYLKDGCQEYGARFSSGVLSNRTRTNGHEAKYKKFHLNMGKSFFTLRVTEYWNSFPGVLWSFPLWRHSNPPGLIAV